MAKRRDYAAEYAATKRRAQSAGYQSERQYRKARKAVQTPKRAMPIRRETLETLEPGALERGGAAIREDRAKRKKARKWSEKRSHEPTTRYSAKFPAEQVDAYIDTWVDKPKRHGPGAKRAHLDRMENYLVDVAKYMTRTEFNELYRKPS